MKKKLKEEAPTNSMGSSSSVASTGSIDTFSPVMKKKKKLRNIINDRRNRDRS